MTDYLIIKVLNIINIKGQFLNNLFQKHGDLAQNRRKSCSGLKKEKSRFC